MSTSFFSSLLAAIPASAGDAAMQFVPPPGAVVFVEDIAYLLAAVLFIFGIKKLSSPRTARRGNMIAALGMIIAIVATLWPPQVAPEAAVVTENVVAEATVVTSWYIWAIMAMLIGSIIGLVLAIRVQMTGMPQLVGAFNGFGGLASILVVTSEYWRVYSEWKEAVLINPEAQLTDVLTFDRGLTMGLGLLIGGVTFTGSFVAFGKLQGILPGRPIQWPAQLPLNVVGVALAFIGCLVLAIEPQLWWVVAAMWVLSFVLGVTLLVPVGGADMPVGVCLLNSYSGLAAAMTGFILSPPNKALMVSGALVGASGIILTYIMCKAMNRSLANVLFAGVGTDDSTGTSGTKSDRTVRSVDPEEFAMLLEDASKVVIVPGYGMAVAQAQYAVRDMFNKLQGKGIEVVFGIHPVAGRMPGHMNVLLAEVDIPYDKLLELDDVNAELETADIALVLGANDVVNPAARHDKSSAIYGMPIIDVDKARTCVVCKRSLGAGYAGVQNELFFADNTLMLFGDAKKMISEVTSAIEK